MKVSIFALSTVAVCVAAPPAQPKSKPCTAPEYRQFDFWVGDWDAFDVDNPNTVAARTKVDLLLDGCVLREDYLGADGLHGQSFNIYDETRKVWHQSWVTNRGQLLLIEGEMKDGALVLNGTDQAVSKERRVRGTWKPEGKGNVRETAVVSTDGGKTWKLWFDMVLKPHQGSQSHDDPPSPASTRPSHVEASMTADEVTLRQLNEQYVQAFMKADTEWYRAHLKDDFVCIESDGSVLNKNEFLTNAAKGPDVVEWDWGLYRRRPTPSI